MESGISPGVTALNPVNLSDRVITIRVRRSSGRLCIVAIVINSCKVCIEFRACALTVSTHAAGHK